MLTNLEESGRKKCAVYWPDDEKGRLSIAQAGKYGSITLNHVSQTQTRQYIVAQLTIEHAGETRNLMHVWYNTWPEKGTPQDKQGVPLCAPFLEMMHEIDETMQYLDGPVLVHCSAGIGRTGVYLATDICTGDLQMQGHADIVKTVNELRSDRGGLVQDSAQLTYVHSAVSYYAESYGHDVNGLKVDRTLGTITIEGVKYQFVDLDGDGLMSREEAFKQNMGTEVFDAIDDDGSGEISRDEFRAFVQKQVNESARRGNSTHGAKDVSWLKNASTDVSLGTILIDGKVFCFVDIDGDGTMSFEEATEQNMPKSVFDEIDDDGNGSITKQEFKDYVAKQVRRLIRVCKPTRSFE